MDLKQTFCVVKDGPNFAETERLKEAQDKDQLEMFNSLSNTRLPAGLVTNSWLCRTSKFYRYDYNIYSKTFFIYSFISKYDSTTPADSSTDWNVDQFRQKESEKKRYDY